MTALAKRHRIKDENMLRESRLAFSCARQKITLRGYVERNLTDIKKEKFYGFQ